ncbi:hypothetical protein [Streptomyces sp. NPDC058247]|uniref:hypothetical protein n=1 Tax=Streptomyces sp. NPDC058247 TaxID=3346401 RepID=UPI0036E4DE19
MNATEAQAESPPDDFRFAGSGPMGRGLDRYDALRRDHPVMRVEEPGGVYWMVLKRELTRSCLQDTATFSSAAITPLDPDPAFRMIPVQLDPPEHKPWRHLLAGRFSPKRMAGLRPRLRSSCPELPDEIAARDGCDYVAEFAERFSTLVFLELVGLRASDLDLFLTWENDILRFGDSEADKNRKMAATVQVMGYFTERIAERRTSGRVGDDISQALTWEIDGDPIPDEALLNCCLLLFLAGLDTVTNTLSFAMRHLATHEGTGGTPPAPRVTACR